MGYIMELRKIIGTRPIIMVGACTILMNEHRQILLQQRKDNGLWGLPGGSLEPGESMEEVARRELYEETGLIEQLPADISPPDQPVIQAFIKSEYIK